MLNQKIAVYIPSTINGNEVAPVETVAKWVKAAKIKLANLFGGFTAHLAQGGWHSSELGLIEETVTVVAAFTDEEGLTKVAHVETLAQQIASDMKQEAVSVEVNGELRFVRA